MRERKKKSAYITPRAVVDFFFPLVSLLLPPSLKTSAIRDADLDVRARRNRPPPG